MKEEEAILSIADSPGEVTCLISSWRKGDDQAQDQLFNLIYHELKAIAMRRLARSGVISLNSTELVNESLLRLLERVPDARNREHLFKIAAAAIRCTLIDLARRHNAEKRGGGACEVTLSLADQHPVPSTQWAEVEAALVELDERDPRKCRIAELALLVGLSQQEIAQTMGISLSTVERELRFSKAWLREQLSP